MIQALEQTKLLPGDEGLKAYISNWSYCSTYLNSPSTPITEEFLLKLIKLELQGKNRIQMLRRLFTKYYTLVREEAWVDLLTLSEEADEARSHS